MSNQRKRKNSRYNAPKPLPLTAPTQAKASGLAYSASIMFLMILSMFASIAMGLANKMPKAGERKPDWYIYLNYLLPQIALILVTVLYFSWLKRPVKETIRKQKCNPKYFLLAILLQVGLLSLGSLNEMFASFLKRFGYQDSAPILPNLDGFGLVATIFCVAVLPAVFEEIFFRGILLKGLRSFGIIGSIVLCGALFSLYHQNPVQTVYQFACGVAFAFITIRSGSVLPTIVSHFLNNTIVIVLARLGVNEIPSSVYLPYVMVTSLCLIASLGYLFFFDRERAEIEVSKPKKGQEKEIKSERVRFFVCALVGIAVFAVNWMSALVSGF
jgi:membrane protease YdiL (CAAX protease family)